MSIFSRDTCQICKKMLPYGAYGRCIDCNLSIYYLGETEGEAKMKNTFVEENISIAQEAATFGYQAVQGIIEAHKDKSHSNCKCVPFKKVPLTQEEVIRLARERHEGYQEGYLNAASNYLNSFTFSDFDKSVKRTWEKQNFKDAVSNASLGLTGEAGEVADLVKKAIYHGRYFKADYNKHNFKAYHREDGTVSPEDVKDELSDILFYVSAMAQEFGYGLEDIAHHNKEKLEKRYEKGFTTEESAKKKDKHPAVDEERRELEW